MSPEANVRASVAVIRAGSSPTYSAQPSASPRGEELDRLGEVLVLAAAGQDLVADDDDADGHACLVESVEIAFAAAARSSCSARRQ